MKNILILCTGNSCRSQIAHGFLNHLTDNSTSVFSAGIEKHGLNKNAVKCMADIGIDISHQNSNLVDEYINERFDFIITVCDNANETCPIFPGKVERIHWNIDDPFKRWFSDSHDLVNFRKTRENLRRRIKNLLRIRLV